MGRRYTGVWTIHDAKKIEISRLVKAGIVKKGRTIWNGWQWLVDGVVTFHTWIYAVYNDSEQYVQFTYTHTTRDREKTKMDYKVKLLEKPSNLGVGKVVFFICPVSNKPCRSLYMAYGSQIFKSREAYQNRIYYPLQQSSKRSRSNDQYWELEQHIKQASKGRAANKYAGRLTRRAARLNRLLEKQDYADLLRWRPSAFPVGLRHIFDGLEGFE